MGHWAKIKSDRVIQVIVADDDRHDWLTKTFGGTWVQTSYNTRQNTHLLGGTPFRGNYAGVGYLYLEAEDIFMPPKPYDSWVLNAENARWDPPVPMPEDENTYAWNEATQSWDVVSEV